MEQRTHFHPNLYAHVAHKGELLNWVPIGVPPPFSSMSEGLVSMLKGPSSSVPAPASLHQRHHPAVLIRGAPLCLKGKIVEEIPRERGEKLLHNLRKEKYLYRKRRAETTTTHKKRGN